MKFARSFARKTIARTKQISRCWNINRFAKYETDNAALRLSLEIGYRRYENVKRFDGNIVFLIQDTFIDVFWTRCRDINAGTNVDIKDDQCEIEFLLLLVLRFAPDGHLEIPWCSIESQYPVASWHGIVSRGLRMTAFTAMDIQRCNVCAICDVEQIDALTIVNKLVVRYSYTKKLLENHIRYTFDDKIVFFKFFNRSLLKFSIRRISAFRCQYPISKSIIVI